MKKKTLLLVGLAIVGALAFRTHGKALAATWDTEKQSKVVKGAFTFYAHPSQDGKESWIYKVKGDKKKGSLTTLEFPKTIEGMKVTKLGADDQVDPEVSEFDRNIFDVTVEEAHNCDGANAVTKKIKKLIFPETVNEITNDAFSGFYALKKVKLPDGLQKVNKSLFYGCKNLKEVGLPKNMKKLYVQASYNTWTSAFAKCPKLVKFTLSSKNKNFTVKKGMILSKDGKKLLFAAPALKTVKIPAGVKRIEAAALGDSGVETIEIPKSVSYIGEKALSVKKVAKIKLDKKNKYFAKDQNTIYRKGDRSLAVIIVNKKHQAVVSDKIKVLGKDISVAGPKIKRVDLSKNLKKVIEDWMFWGDRAMSGLTVYFHGKKPPVIESKYSGQEYTAIPIFEKVYVPKGTKKAYVQWAKNRDGLTFDSLKEF